MSCKLRTIYFKARRDVTDRFKILFLIFCKTLFIFIELVAFKLVKMFFNLQLTRRVSDQYATQSYIILFACFLKINFFYIPALFVSGDCIWTVECTGVQVSLSPVAGRTVKAFPPPLSLALSLHVSTILFFYRRRNILFYSKL